MNSRHSRHYSTSVFAIALCVASIAGFAMAYGQQAPQPNAPGTASRRVGKIKGINGMVVTLTPDSGPEINIVMEDVTRIRRIAPGEMNPKNATPLEFKDLQVGDLIRVVGIASDDGKSIAAASIVALKASDVEARRQQDMQDWQKRGIDGPVATVDAAAGMVTIKVRGKDVIIRCSKSTVILRYPPDQWKFEDAQPGSLQQIHPGDQARARQSQCRRKRDASRGNCFGIVPHYYRHGQLRRCKFLDGKRPRSVGEENGDNQGYAGVSASPLAA